MQAIREFDPDMVIVDISLKDTSGVELIKDLKVQYPDLPVLTLSMHDEAVYGERALRAGARGYIMKQEATEKVVTAIRRVLAGEVYVSDGMAAKMVSKLVGGGQQEARLARRDSQRPRARGLSHDRRGLQHPRNGGEAAPERQDDRDVPRPHQGQARPAGRQRAAAFRHPVGQHGIAAIADRTSGFSSPALPSHGDALIGKTLMPGRVIRPIAKTDAAPISRLSPRHYPLGMWACLGVPGWNGRGRPGCNTVE